MDRFLEKLYGRMMLAGVVNDNQYYSKLARMAADYIEITQQ